MTSTTTSTRRSTLAAIDANQNNGHIASTLPVPSSAVKSAKTYQPRASMIPQQSNPIRNVSATAATITTTTAAASTRDSLLQSTQQPIGSTAVHSASHSARRADSGMYAGRQSVASAGRQSVAVTTPATPNSRRSVVGRLSIAPGNIGNTGGSGVRETRPIKDKHYKTRMGLTVKEHLERTGFTMVGWDVNKGVHEPTQSAFVGMFKHIYATCIDTNFQMGADGKKFEDEVLTLMKEIKYPAADELSKTKLTAAGSQSHWPYCLAMLEWMVNLGNQAETIGTGPRSRPDEIDDLQSLFFPYLWDCYDRFWQNEDTYPEEHAKLGVRFEQKNAAIERELRDLQQDHARLEAELADYLNNDSPLKVERSENDMLTKDISKFHKYYDEVLVPKLDKTKKAIERLIKEIALTEKEIDDKNKRRLDLQQQVNAQEMSAEEYERMLAERNRLSKRLEVLGEQNKKAAGDGWSLEIAIAKKQADTEDRISKFNPLARSIALLPFQLASGGVVEELELTPSNPSTMLQAGVDIKGSFRRQIEVLRSHEADQYRQASKKRLTMQEEYEKLQEAVAAQEAQLGSDRERCDALARQAAEYEKSCKTVQERYKADESKLERSTYETEASGSVHLQQAESRLTSLQLSAEHKEEEWSLQRSRMDEDMLSFVVLLSKMKGDVTGQLREIQAAVALKSRDD
ncbi:uncharacterized protein PAN0_001c0622 [Moesziomyces antarcticus]|uniref:Kinetochore protein NDC80 n=1 Tax=Pseudozyma antarctica TaxID=84753 RepID=A0A5C3FFF4_PSEA2|nr:uncharacterized protein PAN0_001c0622 [Moesziomyces antarcticus]GAK62422.1 conserved hypothetical protein [Moesziomyces antarcticus]SPO42970.1 related to kinetochore associated 2 (HEC) [Moesziomyces antarcticus]